MADNNLISRYLVTVGESARVMEYIRSCVFPRQTPWKTPVQFHGTNMDGHVCNCAVMDKVNESIRAFFRKGSTVELTKEELEFLPHELLKRNAKREIHLAWDKLSDHARNNLQDYRICEKHPGNQNSSRTLIVDCWYCRAEREKDEAEKQEESPKF